MTIEQEARDLLNEVCFERVHTRPYATEGRKTNSAIEAICRALEQHDAERQAHADFRQRVSDAMEILQEWETSYVKWQRGDRAHFVELQGGRRVTFSDFIIPKPVDPLVEALNELWGDGCDKYHEDAGKHLRAALAKRGLVVREEG